MILVAIDPSLRSTGLAIFQEGSLIHAESVKVRTRPGGGAQDIAARAFAMAGEVARHVRAAAPVDPLQIVVEWPQIYRGPKAQGDPNDLPALAAVGVAIAALVGAQGVQSYTPREWAGQVPKATKGDCRDSPRARRIRSRLSAPELEVWSGLRPSDHDAIDAIGIGCHALGRVRSPAAAEGTTGLLSLPPA